MNLQAGVESSGFQVFGALGSGVFGFSASGSGGANSDEMAGLFGKGGKVQK